MNERLRSSLKYTGVFLLGLLIGAFLLETFGSYLRPSFGDLRYYERADPDKDIENAISRNDLRFIALMGYAELPGITDFFKAEKYGNKYGRKIITGTGDDVIHGYDHGRLITIAHYYAESYNFLLMKHINKLESRALSKQLPGYEQVISKFAINDVRTSNLNMLPYSFHAAMTSKTRQCVNLAWWFDPIEKERPRYDWSRFLKTYQEVNDVVCAHGWIQEWIDAGADRNVRAQIFGIKPYTETSLDLYVQPAWNSAGLKSEPYYEVTLIEGQHWVGTVYISKDRGMALVTASDAKKSNHWLDSHHFHYHPKAPEIEYMVVDQKGNWKLMKGKQQGIQPINDNPTSGSAATRQRRRVTRALV